MLVYFVNDGSFLERFKQLQQEKEKKNEIPNKSRVVSSSLLNSAPKTGISKTAMELKSNCIQKTIKTPSNGKLAFSLKRKSKLVAPSVKLDEDDDDEDDVRNHSDDVPIKRQKLGQPDASYSSPQQVDVAPPFPSDPTVRKVADKLASFVAKNGRQFEHVTRQKNPGDTPFKFLFDESCSDFKYYEYRVREEQTALSETRDSQSSPSGGSGGNIGSATPSTTSGFQASYHHHSKYQTPASALYEATENTESTHASSQTSGRYGESSTPTGSDPIAMMEYYMKKAAAEEMRRPPKASKDEMLPPASLQAPVEKGHHMGDFIPPEELEKFFATCNDASAQNVWKEMADKTKIQADNVGHKLLSRMGWKEGEGLGSSRSGISAPIMAGEVQKKNTWALVLMLQERLHPMMTFMISIRNE